MRAFFPIAAQLSRLPTYLYRHAADPAQRVRSVERLLDALVGELDLEQPSVVGERPGLAGDRHRPSECGDREWQQDDVEDEQDEQIRYDLLPPAVGQQCLTEAR